MAPKKPSGRETRVSHKVYELVMRKSRPPAKTSRGEGRSYKGMGKEGRKRGSFDEYPQKGPSQDKSGD